MTDQASLENVPTRFEGVYTEPGSKRPIAVYEGELPEDDGDAKVYMFRRAVVAGDEIESEGSDSVTIGIAMHREGIHLIGDVAVAASNPEGSTDRPVVFESEAQFKGLLDSLTHAAYLNMESGDIDLAHSLGFSDTESPGRPKLELHEPQDPAEVAYWTFPA